MTNSTNICPKQQKLQSKMKKIMKTAYGKIIMNKAIDKV